MASHGHLTNGGFIDYPTDYFSVPALGFSAISHLTSDLHDDKARRHHRHQPCQKAFANFL
jgi:hypothetical protein